MNSDRTNSGSDFSGVKVGDRLWFLDQQVDVVSVDYTQFNPLRVLLLSGYALECSLRGRLFPDGPQVLFYDKVEITPPPRPKRLVKTTIEVRPYYSKDYGGMGLTTFGLDDTQWTNWLGPVQTIEIEVEE